MPVQGLRASSTPGDTAASHLTLSNIEGSKQTPETMAVRLFLVSTPHQVCRQCIPLAWTPVGA
jgi:hypothetical protein